MTIEWLIQRMASFKEHEAMVFDQHSISYDGLLEEYDRWICIVKNAQIQPGGIVAMTGDYSPQMCGLLLALITNCNIAIPLSHSVRHRTMEMLEIASADWYIEFTKDGRDYEIQSFQRDNHHDTLENLSAVPEPGLVLFTSGTTGAPKGIVYRFDKFLEKYKSIRQANRTMTFLLFDHIGGLNTLFHTLSNGGTVISPDARTPQDICALIEKQRVEIFPTSPSFLNFLLMTRSYCDYDLSSLKVVTYGTEVMPESTLQQLREALPNVQLKQTYGLSELGILRTKSKNSGSLWVRIGGDGYETKVVNQILFIKSQTAMEGYLNAPQPFDEEGWFNTQDQVVVDGDYLRILGRQSEIINVGGRKVYPSEVEDVLIQMPEITDATVRGEANPLLGNIISAVVNVNEQIDAKQLKRMIKEFCSDKLEPYQVPVKVQIQDQVLYSERYKKVRQ